MTVDHPDSEEGSALSQTNKCGHLCPCHVQCLHMNPKLGENSRGVLFIVTNIALKLRNIE